MIVNAKDSYSNITEEYQGFVQSIKTYIKIEMNNSNHTLLQEMSKKDATLRQEIERQSKAT